MSQRSFLTSISTSKSIYIILFLSLHFSEASHITVDLLCQSTNIFTLFCSHPQLAFLCIIKTRLHSLFISVFLLIFCAFSVCFNAHSFYSLYLLRATCLK